MIDLVRPDSSFEEAIVPFRSSRFHPSLASLSQGPSETKNSAEIETVKRLLEISSPIPWFIRKKNT